MFGKCHSGDVTRCVPASAGIDAGTVPTIKGPKGARVYVCVAPCFSFLAVSIFRKVGGGSQNQLSCQRNDATHRDATPEAVFIWVPSVSKTEEFLTSKSKFNLTPNCWWASKKHSTPFFDIVKKKADAVTNVKTA